MRRIRRKRTAPEEAVAAMLRSLGVRYRRNVRFLPGSPDFVNKRGRWAIFVMGCFWHHHTNCPRATVPTRNRAYWERKFEDNRRRDAVKVERLRSIGIKPLLLWECDIEERPDRCRERLDGILHRRHSARTGA